MSRYAAEAPEERGLPKTEGLKLFSRVIRVNEAPVGDKGQPQWAASRGHSRTGTPHRLVCVQGVETHSGEVDKLHVLFSVVADPRRVAFARFLYTARKTHGFKVVSIASTCLGTLSSAAQAGLRVNVVEAGGVEGLRLVVPQDFGAISHDLERLASVAARGLVSNDAIWL